MDIISINVPKLNSTYIAPLAFPFSTLNPPRQTNQSTLPRSHRKDWTIKPQRCDIQLTSHSPHSHSWHGRRLQLKVKVWSIEPETTVKCT